MPPTRRHCRRIGAHYSCSQLGHMCAQTPHMHTRYTTDARRRHARASTRWLRSGATSAPRHAPPTPPQRPLRQPRAKRALPALRPATLGSARPPNVSVGCLSNLLSESRDVALLLSALLANAIESNTRSVAVSMLRAECVTESIIVSTLFISTR